MNFGTLCASAGSARLGTAATTDALAGSVQGLLRASRAARVVAAVCRRAAGRQCAQVDVGDVGAGDRADVVSGVSALHHPCAVGRRSALASIAQGAARAHGHSDPRRNQFSQTGAPLGGVARQYCGALGKVANCQVAVTAALWTGRRAWPLGALLYLPETWTSDLARRAATRIPAALVFQEKWRLALTLVRRSRAAGLTLTGVVAEAEYGDNSTVRQTLHRLRLPYALGISPTLTVFRGTPTLRIDRQQPPPRNRRDGWPDQEAVSVRALSDTLPARAWRRVAWRNGTNPPWEADFAACRVTPATDWRHRRLAPEIWLLCERGVGPTGRRKHYFVSLPPSASLTQIVRLAHHRWAIEQQYQDLKSELGLDHFEGRTYPGWQHHVVISAVAFA